MMNELFLTAPKQLWRYSNSPICNIHVSDELLWYKQTKILPANTDLNYDNKTTEIIKKINIFSLMSKLN